MSLELDLWNKLLARASPFVPSFFKDILFVERVQRSLQTSPDVSLQTQENLQKKILKKTNNL